MENLTRYLTLRQNESDSTYTIYSTFLNTELREVTHLFSKSSVEKQLILTPITGLRLGISFERAKKDSFLQ